MLRLTLLFKNVLTVLWFEARKRFLFKECLSSLSSKHSTLKNRLNKGWTHRQCCLSYQVSFVLVTLVIQWFSFSQIRFQINYEFNGVIARNPSTQTGVEIQKANSCLQLSLRTLEAKFALTLMSIHIRDEDNRDTYGQKERRRGNYVCRCHNMTSHKIFAAVLETNSWGMVARWNFISLADVSKSEPSPTPVYLCSLRLASGCWK